MREYRASKLAKIIAIIGAPPICGSAGFILFQLYTAGPAEIPTWVYFIATPIFVGLGGIGVVGLIEVFFSKLVVDTEKIYTTGPLPWRKIMLSDIKGYRTDEQDRIIIESRNKRDKKIRFSGLLEHADELANWLYKNYPNLDALAARKQIEEIAGNAALGFTAAEREAKLVAARRLALATNILSFVAIVAMGILPDFYKYFVALFIAGPVVLLAVLKMGNGLIRVGIGKKSEYPSVFVAIGCMMLALILKGKALNIPDHSNFWLPAASLGAGYFIMFSSVTEEYFFKGADKVAKSVTAAFMVLAYGSYSVLLINCVYDTSSPQLYSAVVLEKGAHASVEFITNYEVELSEWEGGKTNECCKAAIRQPGCE